MIMSLIEKKWLMLSKVQMPPARLTAETAAPTLCLSTMPLARVTYPARSMRAFASVVRSEKYVGDPIIIPSAAMPANPAHWKSAIQPLHLKK